jgi:hypothetical protein
VSIDVTGTLENLRLVLVDPSSNRPLALLLLGLATTALLILGVSVALWAIRRRG